jgi:hypothetical protein
LQYEQWHVLGVLGVQEMGPWESQEMKGNKCPRTGEAISLYFKKTDHSVL